MATGSTKLVASTYARSNSTYVTVTNASNMYKDTDDTSATYATLSSTRASTTTYYVYIRGFNFSALPGNASVTSFTVRIKGYETGLNTGTSYSPSLVNGTSLISSTTASTNFGTTTKTITVPTGALTWTKIVNYGSTFGIRVTVGRAASGTKGYLYIYGAEIEVNYTYTPYYLVYTSNRTTSSIVPASVYVKEGESLTVSYYSSRSNCPTLIDNGSNVTSRQIFMTNLGPVEYTVTDVPAQSGKPTGHDGFTLNANDYYESTNSGVANSVSLCRIDFYTATGCSVTFSVINYAEEGKDYGLISELDTTLAATPYDDSDYDEDPDKGSVYWNGKTHNSASVQTVTYSSISPGKHFFYVKFIKNGSVDSYNDSLQFKVTITRTSGDSSSYWGYTLSNISEQHQLIYESPASSLPIQVKQNGSWTTAQDVMVKKNGAWVEPQHIYVKENGTWKMIK